MMGSVAGLYTDFFVWSTGEEVLKKYMEGGSVELSSAPVNFAYKKIRKLMGKEAGEGLAYTLKFAGEKGVKGALAKGTLEYLFNPWVAAGKEVIGAVYDHKKEVAETDFQSAKNNADLSMSYKLNEKHHMINQNLIMNAQRTGYEVQKIIYSGNLAEEMLNNVFRCH